MPTLAELKAKSGPQPLPKSSVLVTLIEGQHLLDESKQLAQEAQSLIIEETRLKQEVSRTSQDGEQSGPPRKAGEGAAAVRRLDEIAARLDEIGERQSALVDEMDEFQGTLDLTGFDGGKWQRFKDDNPPREDSDPDSRLAGGNCNSSVLFGQLGKFVRAWDGEPVTEQDWDEWLAERICYADRRDMVPAVVSMHEGKAAHRPKSRSGSPTTSPSATA